MTYGSINFNPQTRLCVVFEALLKTYCSFCQRNRHAVYAPNSSTSNANGHHLRILPALCSLGPICATVKHADRHFDFVTLPSNLNLHLMLKLPNVPICFPYHTLFSENMQARGFGLNWVFSRMKRTSGLGPPSPLHGPAHTPVCCQLELTEDSQREISDASSDAPKVRGPVDTSRGDVEFLRAQGSQSSVSVWQHTLVG